MTKIKTAGHIKTFFDSFLDFLFPVDESVQDMQKVSAEELKRLLPSSKHDNDWILSLFAYRDERVKHLVWEIKYYQNEKMADAIGVLLAEKIKADLKSKVGLKTEEFLVIPIPLTKRRLNERGFNHTDLIAKSVVKNLPKNFVLTNNLIKKVRHTHKQSSIEDRQERFINMHGVFEVTQPEIIRDKNILIIDDVTTTGATLGEAKRVMIAAGARSVKAYVVAH